MIRLRLVDPVDQFSQHELEDAESALGISFDMSEDRHSVTVSFPIEVCDNEIVGVLRNDGRHKNIMKEAV